MRVVQLEISAQQGRRLNVILTIADLQYCYIHSLLTRQNLRGRCAGLNGIAIWLAVFGAVVSVGGYLIYATSALA